VARELARISLPLGTYTNKIWAGCLKNLFDFLGLRMDGHAQWEIRQYATVIGEIVAEIFPLAWEAFYDYRLHSLSLSLPEQRVLGSLANRYGLETWPLSKREEVEFKAKLKRMGLGMFLADFDAMVANVRGA
jgi:thymidylate synthase (FAD)